MSRQLLPLGYGVLCASLVAFVLGGCASGTDLPRQAAREFLPDSARQYVEFLASDELQGRATPSAGLLQAATFIAEAFRRWGLEPVGESYWHPYSLVRRDLRRESLWLRFRFGDTLWEAAIPDHAVPMPMTGEGSTEEAPLVLLQRLPADTAAFQPSAPLPRGSVVLMVRSRQEGRADTATQGASARVSLWGWLRWMRRHGVAGVLLADVPQQGQRLRPRRFPWPSLSQHPSISTLPFQLPDTDTAVPVVYSIGAEVLERLFGSVDAFRQIVEQQESLPGPVVKPLPGIKVELSLAFREIERVEVPNVVGILRGRSRPQEYVLIGAHYDHVGVTALPGVADSIYNGADDNASGTAGLMLIARALGRLPKKPSRSIVFVAFSGEERGLLGSRAFVQNPPLPLKHCLAMLNLDMIGRNHPDSLLVGVRGQWLESVVQAQNRALPRPFLLGREAEEFFGRSDHASFARHGIPVLFLFTGLHEDYHRPSDHAEKLNYDKLSRVALLAARVAWALATMPAVPPAP